jgi:hypothetical protein
MCKYYTSAGVHIALRHGCRLLWHLDRASVNKVCVCVPCVYCTCVLPWARRPEGPRSERAVVQCSAWTPLTPARLVCKGDSLRQSSTAHAPHPYHRPLQGALYLEGTEAVRGYINVIQTLYCGHQMVQKDQQRSISQEDI